MIGISGSLIWSKILIFNPCGEFRCSPKGPVSQINSPHLLVGAPGIFSDLLRSVQMLKREWGTESNRKLPHLFIPSKTATQVPEFAMEDLTLGRIAVLVPEFAVKDLPLGRTLMMIYTLYHFFFFAPPVKTLKSRPCFCAIEFKHEDFRPSFKKFHKQFQKSSFGTKQMFLNNEITVAEAVLMFFSEEGNAFVVDTFLFFINQLSLILIIVFKPDSWIKYIGLSSGGSFI